MKYILCPERCCFEFAKTPAYKCVCVCVYDVCAHASCGVVYAFLLCVPRYIWVSVPMCCVAGCVCVCVCVCVWRVCVCVSMYMVEPDCESSMCVCLLACSWVWLCLCSRVLSPPPSLSDRAEERLLVRSSRSFQWCSFWIHHYLASHPSLSPVAQEVERVCW